MGYCSDGLDLLFAKSIMGRLWDFGQKRLLIVQQVKDSTVERGAEDDMSFDRETKLGCLSNILD